MKLYLKFLILLTFCLIALGGATRAMDAGLACPDWPLCFGKIIPDFQVQVYYEFIHRALAGFVALLTVGMSIQVFRSKEASSAVKKTLAISLGILAIQIIMGGLTVLKLLNFKVVTTHLVLGLTFLCCLLWVYFLMFTKKVEGLKKAPKSFVGILGFVFFLVVIQIILGGMVSSNYAGLACGNAFPLCHGELVPTLKGLVGLQVMHRLWGYLTVIGILALYSVIRKLEKAPWFVIEIKKMGRMLVSMVILQIAVGAMNVVFKIPPVMTVIHLALATVILGTMLRILFLGWIRKA